MTIAIVLSEKVSLSMMRCGSPACSGDPRAEEKVSSFAYALNVSAMICLDSL